MVGMKLCVKVPSENLSKRQLLPTPVYHHNSKMSRFVEPLIDRERQREVASKDGEEMFINDDNGCRNKRKIKMFVIICVAWEGMAVPLSPTRSILRVYFAFFPSAMIR